MSQSTQTVPLVFDVLGTCFSWDATVDAFDQVFGDQLREKGIPARSVVFDWFHSAQRDFTYLSVNNSYTPITQVLKAILPRVLLQHGFTSPTPTASSPSPSSPTSPFPSSVLEPVLSTLSKMTPRESLAPSLARLLGAGTFCLMAATNGGADNTLRLLVRALGEDQAKRWEVFSCDEVRRAKPDPAVYEGVWKRLGLENGAQRKAWFIASHNWDLFAAKKAGFKTAWASYEEHVLQDNIFGKPDIVGLDLDDVAKQIIAAEKTQ